LFVVFVVFGVGEKKEKKGPKQKKGSGTTKLRESQRGQNPRPTKKKAPNCAALNNNARCR
jgi:hypothetical protein